MCAPLLPSPSPPSLKIIKLFQSIKPRPLAHRVAEDQIMKMAYRPVGIAQEDHWAEMLKEE